MTSQASDTRARYMITFAKEGALRYCGQLDMQRTMERTLRRAKLPIAYSQGFHPHPKINLGAALPLGIISHCEVADIWLDEPRPAGLILEQLQGHSPEGLRFIEAQHVSPQEPTMQSRIQAAEYHILWPRDDVPEDLEQRVKVLMRSHALIRERRGKQYDLRPLIENAELSTSEDDVPMLIIKVSLLPGNTGRPDEVLRAMDLDPYQPDIIRTRFFLDVKDSNPD